jgi:hypothetical protein
MYPGRQNGMSLMKLNFTDFIIKIPAVILEYAALHIIWTSYTFIFYSGEKIPVILIKILLPLVTGWIAGEFLYRRFGVKRMNTLLTILFILLGLIEGFLISGYHRLHIEIFIIWLFWWRGICLGYYKFEHYSFLRELRTFIVLIYITLFATWINLRTGPLISIYLSGITPYTFIFFFTGFLLLALLNAQDFEQKSTALTRDNYSFRKNWFYWAFLFTSIILSTALIVSGLISPEVFRIMLDSFKTGGLLLTDKMIFLLYPIGFLLYLLKLLLSKVLPGEDFSSPEAEGFFREWIIESQGARLTLPQSVSNFLKGFLLLGLFLAVAVFLLKIIGRASRRDSKNIEEERESVFSFNLVSKGLMENFENLRKRFSAVKRKRKLKGDCPEMIARQIFVNILRNGEQIGIPKEIHETPSEYIENFTTVKGLKKMETKSLIKEFLGIYEDVRYGEIKPAEEKVLKLHKTFDELFKYGEDNKSYKGK